MPKKRDVLVDSDRKSTNNSIIEIICFTDPYCTWCWGSEPILRKIQEVYAEQVKISYTMGGLVKDIGNFSDPANGIAGTQWYRQVADHWVEASQQHKMPVDEQIFFEIKDDYRSTYPANIAFKASQFQGEAAATRYLRLLRSGAAAENRAIHRLEVQIEIAEEVGLNVERFVQDIQEGNAEQAFQEDLLACRKRAVRGFPSYLLRGPEGEVMLRSFTTYEQFEYWFEELVTEPLSHRTLQESAAQIVDFVARYGKVAPMEIAGVYGISIEAAQARLKSMAQSGVLVEMKAGNGHLYSLPIDAQGCDAETGSCSFPNS
ncbi:DsbA family protein [Photobacterium sagamiensis]|uniref:DsbA family protein n=1 Tax=Photobacterium sagamiensis TaxID=2910241 RepID=UPI003D0C1C77